MPVAGIYSVNWDDDGADRRPQLRGRGRRDRQRRPHADVLESAPSRRQQRADRRRRGARPSCPAPRTSTYDAAGKTLWLNATSPARSSCGEAASDPDSGIASVTFPALLGTGSNPGTLTPASTPSTRLQLQLAGGAGLAVDHARRTASPNPVRPRRAATRSTSRSTARRRRRTRRSRSTTARTTTRPGSGSPAARHPGERHLRHRHRRRLGRRHGAALDQGPHDRQVLRRRRLRTGRADAAAHGDARRHQLELRARPEQADRAAPLRGRGARDRQRRQRRVRQQIRFTYGADIGRTEHDAHAHERHARCPHERRPNAYDLYYGTALGGGGFTIHVDATDPSGVDTVDVPRSLRRRAASAAPAAPRRTRATTTRIAVDSSGVHASRAVPTIRARPANVTSTDLRGNSGNDVVTFMLDNASPTGGSLNVTPADANGYATTTSLTRRAPRLYRRRRLGRRVVDPHRRLGRPLERRLRQLRLRDAGRRRRLHGDRRHLLPLHAHRHRPRRQRGDRDPDGEGRHDSAVAADRRLQRPLEREHVRRRRGHALLPPVGRRHLHA